VIREGWEGGPLRGGLRFVYPCADDGGVVVVVFDGILHGILSCRLEYPIWINVCERLVKEGWLGMNIWGALEQDAV